MSLLDEIIRSAPFFNAVLFNDTAIAVTSLEKYLYYLPGKKLNHGVKPGDSLRSGSLVVKAMQTRQRQEAVADSNLFGVAYVGSAIPIVESNGDVVGCLFIGESIERHEAIRVSSEGLDDDLSRISTLMRELTSLMHEMSLLQESLTKQLTYFNGELASIEDFAKILDHIAKQTNMLGINAAIESARIGELGRGFSVVSDEISKLAKRSQESVTNINMKAISIQRESTQIVDQVVAINSAMVHSQEGIQTIMDALLISKERVDLLKKQATIQ